MKQTINVRQQHYQFKIEDPPGA